MPRIITIGTLREIEAIRKQYPHYSLEEVRLHNRKMKRWLQKNKKTLKPLLLALPLCASFFLPTDFVLAATHSISPETIPVGGTVKELFEGDARILLYIVLLSFVALIITTFLRFTGIGGGFVPLIGFITGVIILNMVIGLFNKLYQNLATLLGL